MAVQLQLTDPTRNQSRYKTRQVYRNDVKYVAMMDGQLDDDTAGI